jgi:8-oxo-dGTP pyrophosphatase MutT (NUDIX family)
VCFNLAGQVLLVSALGREDQWVFPKGHIEPNEETFETAERECAEETGVRALVTGSPIGITTYESSYNGKKETVVVEWWAGTGVGIADRNPLAQWEEYDWRTTTWVYPEEALKMLTFEDTRAILRKALCYKEPE